MSPNAFMHYFVCACGRQSRTLTGLIYDCPCGRSRQYVCVGNEHRTIHWMQAPAVRLNDGCPCCSTTLDAIPAVAV